MFGRSQIPLRYGNLSVGVYSTRVFTYFLIIHPVCALSAEPFGFMKSTVESALGLSWLTFRPWQNKAQLPSLAIL